MSSATSSQAQKVIDLCRFIAEYSETPGSITRTYLSPPVRQVHNFLQSWMSKLGMESRVDAVGNLRGIRRCGNPGARRLLMGSHIDTVPNAGAFDGVLGVVMALALVEALQRCSLYYDIEVVAFSEEEGVRFAIPFLGSRALIGDFDDPLLRQQDDLGITVAKAIEEFGLRPAEIPGAAIADDAFGYLEFHIEQGPVLEDLGIGLGIVEVIVGQSRYELRFVGDANHAGTTPMHLRRDALAGAAEWITAVERMARAAPGLVATVGRVEALPGATNVIPGDVRLSLDVRHASDSARIAHSGDLLNTAASIATSRGLAVHTALRLDQRATPMNPALALVLESAAAATGTPPHRMASGAGHDAMVMAKKLPAAMLFLRSPGGISHHPDESVLLEDVRAALDAGLYFFKHLDASAIMSSKH